MANARTPGVRLVRAARPLVPPAKNSTGSNETTNSPRPASFPGVRRGSTPSVFHLQKSRRTAQALRNSPSSAAVAAEVQVPIPRQSHRPGPRQELALSCSHLPPAILAALRSTCELENHGGNPCPGTCFRLSTYFDRQGCASRSCGRLVHSTRRRPVALAGCSALRIPSKQRGFKSRCNSLAALRPRPAIPGPRFKLRQRTNEMPIRAISSSALPFPR